MANSYFRKPESLWSLIRVSMKASSLWIYLHSLHAGYRFLVLKFWFPVQNWLILLMIFLCQCLIFYLAGLLEIVNIQKVLQWWQKAIQNLVQIDASILLYEAFNSLIYRMIRLAILVFVSRIHRNTFWNSTSAIQRTSILRL